MKHYVGIDLGGTNIKAVLVNERFERVRSRCVPTPVARGPETVFEHMIGLVEGLLDGASVDRAGLKGIGVGVPGLIDHRSGIVYDIKNFRWRETNVPAPLQRRFGVPVHADNDGALNALGEMLFGAGRGCKNLIVLTLGTGIGCGIVADGTPLRGRNNFAAEVGHMVIELGGERCVCGKRGCFEACCSAGALIRYAAGFAGEDEASFLRARTAGNLDRITGELIAEGYDLFDPACRDAMRLFSEKLSVGLVNLIDIFNPERIILSGGVSGAGRRLLDGVMPLVEANLMTPAQKCDIVIGELFSDAGALGACALAAEGEGK